ncbi:MAG: hypothetical protein ABJF01_08860 [bacterium]
MRSIVALLIATVSASAATLHAQTIETPVPFDSARRVMAVTPVLAERLQLATPTWPVRGEYRESRLYSVSPAGGFMLVVVRLDGAMERIPLTALERTSLGAVVDASMSRAGRPTADVAANIVSEPAGNAFARHQTFLAAVAYGPLAASLTDDASQAGAAYLAVTGLTFFISYGAAQSNRFTRAQSDLAGDLGLAGGAAGYLLAYAAAGNSDKGVRAVSLGSVVVGTVVGAALGRTLTDAEAHAATLGIESASVFTLAANSLAGAPGRGTAAAVAVVGLAAGYPIGVWYPRKVGYTVTAGDVEATSTAGLVAGLFGAAALGHVDHPSARQVSSYVAPAYLAGILIGDRMLARPFDLTQVQANVIRIGAVAGGLVGLVVPVLSGNDSPTLSFSAAGIGAALGMAVIAGGFLPSSSASSRVGGDNSNARGLGRARLSFAPSGIFAALGGAKGMWTVARLTF